MRKGSCRSELLALHADRDATGREYVDDGFAGDGVFDVLKGSCIVGRRRCIRHTYDAGESAGGSGRGAGMHGFLVRLTGDAKVDVKIDKPRAYNETFRVDHSGFFESLCVGRVGDFAVDDVEIARFVASIFGINDAAVFDVS